MKNSAPNRFIWAHILKKAPTSEGATSPFRHPPASRKRDGRRWRAIFDFKKSGPPYFENCSAACACRPLILKSLATPLLKIDLLMIFLLFE